MHPIQEKLLRLIETKNIGGMTLRGIGALIDEKLPQKIKHHLFQLERKGFIVVDKNKALISRISGKVSSSNLFISVPIMGSANCGPRTIYADENIEGYLKISKKLLPKKEHLFAIRAKGNSLNRASINGKNIEEGDYIIIDSGSVIPRSGDYIVSVIDNMANIKKYVWDDKNSQILLVSESTHEYSPIFVHENDDILINGKVVEVIKKPTIK